MQMVKGVNIDGKFYAQTFMNNRHVFMVMCNMKLIFMQTIDNNKNTIDIISVGINGCEDYITHIDKLGVITCRIINYDTKKETVKIFNGKELISETCESFDFDDIYNRGGLKCTWSEMDKVE